MNGSDPAPSFVDTNVLVYAADKGDSVRGPVARSLLEWLMTGMALLTGTQVLQECYAVLTRKGKPSIGKDEALRFLDAIAQYPVTQVDYRAIRESAELSALWKISFRDALIVVAAARSGARRLYTEDLQHKQVILGVEIVNPFVP
jgi:predicted nucleic acid-binding protein